MILAQLAAALVVLTVGGWLIATLLLRREVAPDRSDASRHNGSSRAEGLPAVGWNTVMLGVASTLRYLAGFTDGPRQVPPDREWVGDLVAMDLGTKVTARANPEDAGARVVVREGRVAIRVAGGGEPSNACSRSSHNSGSSAHHLCRYFPAVERFISEPAFRTANGHERAPP